MAKRKWGPAVCLDCAAELVGYCPTCTVARYQAGVREPKDRKAYNAYQREYRKRAAQHPIQGPKMREGARQRMAEYYQRKREAQQGRQGTGDHTQKARRK